MFEQQEAIVRLLRDDDLTTVSLVKQQLVEKGVEAIPNLEDMLALDDQTVTRHVREVLGEIDAREATDEFDLLCPLFPENGDLESANWLLARLFLPGVNFKIYSRLLDQWGDRIADMVAGAKSATEQVGILADYLGNRLGFHGDPNDYYKVDNSLLPRVIETRCGIPISLALVYIIIGKRAGLQIEGVNFPGHFLARCKGVIFDPFERGRILTMGDCERVLELQNLTLESSHLEVASSRVMLRRILANLLYVFQNNEDEANAALMAGWIHSLDRE